MTYTARHIVTEALHECGAVGVGQTPSAEDITRGFDRLNGMIGQWSQKRWVIYRLCFGKVLSTGARHYTVGPTGDIDESTDATPVPITVRPDQLEDGCFLRQINTSAENPTDYPLKLLTSKEDYAKIPQKNLQTFSQFIFYDPALPDGLIYPYPAPQSAIYEIWILYKQTLSAFASLDTIVNLPPAYYEALLYNLSLRLASLYKIPIGPTDALPGLAKAGLDTVRAGNTAIAQLRIDPALRRGGIYNFFGDYFY